MDVSKIVLIAGVLFLLIGGVVIFGKKKGGKLPYKAKALLTANEAEFLKRLEGAMPELRFHTQVCMAALIVPDVPSDHKNFWTLRSKVSQKMIDYVAQDRETGKIVALIELDDVSHIPENDKERDRLTASAGYKTIRWHSKHKPNRAQIKETFSRLR